MYCDAFGLKIPPFNNTPDPRFFFNTPEHEEALASLLYAVDQRKGFVLVTGEVGSGKTLLSRILLNRLSSSVKTAVITNTNLNGNELLRSICREFEIDTDNAGTTAELSTALEQFLLEQYARDRLAVVILDEAQNLPAESLEQLRMLGNLEADDAKLLQIIILGQPELQETFRQPSMRQIYQRVFRTFHLHAFDQSLTAGYIKHRLNVASVPAHRRLFETAAINEIFRYSQGIPRVINQICDNALLAAYAESSDIVSVRLVKEVADQMMSLTPDDRPAKSQSVSPAYPAAPALERRLDVVDGLLRQMAERMERAEQAASAIPSSVKSPVAELSDGRANPITEKLRTSEERLEALTSRIAGIEQRQQSSSGLEGFREIREHVAGAVESEIAALRGLEGNARQILTEAGGESERVRSAALRDEMERMIGEMRSVNQKHQERLTQLLEKSEGELAAARNAREQAEVILVDLKGLQESSSSTLKKAVAESKAVSIQLKAGEAEFVECTVHQMKGLHDQLRAFVEDAQVRNEATQTRTSEMLAQQRADVDTSRRLVEEFQETIRERAAKMTQAGDQILADLKNQTKSIVETLIEMRHRAQARVAQVDASIAQMEHGAHGRMEEAERKIAEVLLRAETEVSTTCRALNNIRECIVSEAEKNRSQAGQLLEQTHELLGKTRDQCASLLASLRTQVADQTQKIEKTWQMAFNDGVKTLNDLQARLAETRILSDRSRSELENLVQGAVVEIGKSKESFDTALNTHRKEVTRLSLEAYAVKADVAKRFEEARKGLDGLIEKHEEGARQRINDFAASIQSKISVAESGTSDRVTHLQKELTSASERADQICKDLREFIDVMRHTAADAHAHYSQEADKAQSELIRLFEKNTTLLDGAGTQVDALSQKARDITEGMESKLEGLKDSAQVHMTTMAQELAGIIANALSQAKQVRQESEELGKSIAAQMARTGDDATKAVSEADKTVGLIRRQSRESLLEVRACMTQMTERSDLLRRELSHLGEEVQSSAKVAIEQLDQTGLRITDQIETLRQSAQREAEGYGKRLTSLRQQVEQSADQVRHSAGKLLDQVQTGATGLRQHAEELLSQAQSGAEKINESAATILLQAQTAAERFREQAQSLLNRAESTAGTVQSAVNDLKSKLTFDSEDTRQQIAEVKQEIGNARVASSEMLEQAAEVHRQAQKQTEELLEQTKALRCETESLLAMPKELVEEAKNQASSLSNMSKKISAVVQQLATAGNSAHQHRTAIEQANADAEEKVDLLRRHTERVGQLVGIIRQLYGTMDARIEKLRGRLLQADDLMRTVPQDIENLRSLLIHDGPAHEDSDSDGSGEIAATPVPTKTAHKKTTQTAARRAITQIELGQPRMVESATALTPKMSSAPNIAQPAPMPEQRKGGNGSKATLGEIVQRNQKLNDWLKQMLGEEALAGKIAELQSERFDPAPRSNAENAANA